MKKIILSISVLMALPAWSSHFGEYDRDSLKLTNALMACSKELAEIAEKGAVAVTGSFSGGELPDGSISTTYTIDFSTGPNAYFNKAQLYRLEISEVVTNLVRPPMNGPTTLTEIQCELTEVGKQ